MKVFVAMAALLQIARCGHVSVKLPYLNPAGVTYVSGYQGHGAALTYAPGGYHPVAPLAYSAPAQLEAHHHVGYAAPAQVETHHVGYAAAQVPAVAAVPFVKHVPTVSQVPVTRFEHHPAVIEKQVDVLKPAISTKKIEVRRPAIQKQFYDIEERVIIRPAGSALVELEEPTSKLQKGPAVVQPLAHAGNFLAPTPLLHHSTPSPLFSPASTPGPIVSSTPTSLAEEEAVVIDNEEFRNAQFRNLQQASSAIYREQQRVGQEQAYQQQEQQLQSQQLARSQEQQQFIQRQEEQQQQQQQLQQIQQQQQLQLQEIQQQQQQLAQNARVAQNQIPQVETRSHGTPLETISRLASHEQGPALVPSLQTSAEENQINQNKLIDLLTARGGVTEIGYSRDGKLPSIGDAGQVRARVISATPAPLDADPAGEHVSTKRVVFSRPIETLQEYDLVEPATKLERVAFQHPTLIKTARLDHVQVHGSVPVVGKALTPAVAHAAVPVYQKTISPAYDLYHH